MKLNEVVQMKGQNTLFVHALLNNTYKCFLIGRHATIGRKTLFVYTLQQPLQITVKQ